MEQTDKKISQMPPLQTVSGDEIVPVVSSGGNYRALVSQIVALARQTMVEAQVGKGLSANDFTDALKAKLEGLSNYDDTEVRALITVINGRLDTILGDGASTAIDTFNEIEAFLAGITDTQTLTGLLAEQKQTITAETDDKLAGKVDKVSGKGLSSNDYTDEEKAKLAGLLPNRQFGLRGYITKDYVEHTNVNFVRSGLLPLDRNSDIVATVAGTNIAAIALYDAAGAGIAYKTAKYDSASTPMTWSSEEFPDNAVFFQVSSIIYDDIKYSNGPTQESREGAMAEALVALGDDKLEKSVWDNRNRQFGYTGHYGMDGKFYTAPNYANSGLIPVNRNFDIEFAANVGGSVASVVFYTADRRFIKAVQIPQTLAQQVLPAADIPEDATFFIISTASPAQSYYRNGSTIEAREGAVSEAIQATKLALFVDEFNAAAGSNGKYDPVNAPDPQHQFYLNKLWLTYEEAVVSMAHINEIYLRGGASMLRFNIRTNMLSAATLPTGWGTGFVYLDGVCLTNSIEVLNVGNIVVDKNSILTGFAYNCVNLHTILGQIDMFFVTAISSDAFRLSSKLQEVRLYRLKTSISFKNCPLLSIASLQYIVDTAANTAEITVTVHPVTYGKLTDEQADIMALLPENLLTGEMNDLSGVTQIDNGVTVNAPKSYFRMVTAPRLVSEGNGKLTLSCDVEGLQAGESMSYRIGGRAYDRPQWIISANGRATFSFEAKNLVMTNVGSLLLYDADSTYTGQGLKLTNFKLSYGEHDALPYTPPLSSITDDATREKAEWLSLMHIAEAKNINFVTTE